MKKYYYNIDFLRCILCISVLIVHFRKVLLINPDFKNIILYKLLLEIRGNSLCVDCFFMLSGFFMFLTTDFGQTIINFVRKKLVRLLPLVIFAAIPSLLGYCIYKQTFTFIFDDIWILFMLQCVGFTRKIITLGNTWFVSVLFWVSCFYFYLFKIINKKIFNIIVASIVYFCYVFYVNSYLVNYKSPFYTFGIFNYGVIRGLAGIGLGYFIYTLCQSIAKKSAADIIPTSKKILYTIIETILLIFILVNLIFGNITFGNHLLIVLSFLFIIILFLMKNGYISNFLDKKVFQILGHYTYSIYITHIIVRDFCKYIVYKHPGITFSHPVLCVIGTMITVVAVGIFGYHFIEKPATKYFKLNK